MKSFFFILGKIFGGIIAAFCTFLVVFAPKEASMNLGYLILTGILGLLGLYIFIRSDQRIKEIEKTDGFIPKKIKQNISWKIKLIIAIIFLILLVLALFDI